MPKTTVKLNEFPVQPLTMECCRECRESGKKFDCSPNPTGCKDFVIANWDFIKQKQQELEID